MKKTVWNYSLQRGFTVVELLLVMSIFATLTALATVNLGNFQHESQMNVAVNSLLTDLREQQTKAMVGDTEGASTSANFGIRFRVPDASSYTLYRNAIGTANFVVELPDTIQVTTTFTNNDVLFQKGSGQIASASAITLTDTMDGTSKVININRYGIVTAVN